MPEKPAKESDVRANFRGMCHWIFQDVRLEKSSDVEEDIHAQDIGDISGSSLVANYHTVNDAVSEE